MQWLFQAFSFLPIRLVPPFLLLYMILPVLTTSGHKPVTKVTRVVPFPTAAAPFPQGMFFPQGPFSQGPLAQSPFMQNQGPFPQNQSPFAQNQNPFGQNPMAGSPAAVGGVPNPFNNNNNGQQPNSNMNVISLNTLQLTTVGQITYTSATTAIIVVRRTANGGIECPSQYCLLSSPSSSNLSPLQQPQQQVLSQMQQPQQQILSQMQQPAQQPLPPNLFQQAASPSQFPGMNPATPSATTALTSPNPQSNPFYNAAMPNLQTSLANTSPASNPLAPPPPAVGMTTPISSNPISPSTNTNLPNPMVPALSPPVASVATSFVTSTVLVTPTVTSVVTLPPPQPTPNPYAGNTSNSLGKSASAPAVSEMDLCELPCPDEMFNTSRALT